MTPAFLGLLYFVTVVDHLIFDHRLSDIKFDDLRPQCVVFHMDLCQGAGKAQPPRSGAAGIEKQHSLLVLDRWAVGMAADHRVNTGRCRHQIEFLEIMDQVKQEVTDLNRIGCGILPAPVRRIDITSNGVAGGDCCQDVDDMRFADIAGVEDDILSLKRLQRLRPHQSMCVGNDADDHRFTACSRFR